MFIDHQDGSLSQMRGFFEPFVQYLLATENISKFRFETVFFIYSFLLQTVTHKKLQRSKFEPASLRIFKKFQPGRAYLLI